MSYEIYGALKCIILNPERMLLYLAFKKSIAEAVLNVFFWGTFPVIYGQLHISVLRI